MNNDEREMWIMNDEGLYNWRQREGGTMRDFIKRWRHIIDAKIEAELDQSPRSHGEPIHDPR